MKPHRNSEIAEVELGMSASPASQPRREPVVNPLRDFEQLTLALRQNWWIVAAAILLALLIAALLTRRQTPLYRASTTLVVMPARETKDTGDILKSLETLERRTVMATFSKIPAAPETRAAAAKHLGVDEASIAGYRIQGSVMPNTNIIRIDVEGSDAETAAVVANAAAEMTNAQAKALYRIYAMQTLSRALAPSAPVHPDKRRNYLVGFVLGALIGCAVAVAFPYLRTRARQVH